MAHNRTLPRGVYLSITLLTSGACGGGYITTGMPGQSGASSMTGTTSKPVSTVSIPQGNGVCGTTLTAVGWVNVEPIFAARCNGCHATPLTTAAARSGANAAYNFDTYAAAVNSTQDGAAQMDWTLADDMPPPGNALNLTMATPQEMCLLDEWVRGGNPNVAGTTPQVTLNANNMCATGNTTLTWAEVSPIFARHCTSCHATTLSGAARNGATTTVNFDTEAAAIDAVQNNVAESDWDQPANMPPPGNAVQAQPLDDQESCILDSWVRQLPARP